MTKMGMKRTEPRKPLKRKRNPVLKLLDDLWSELVKWRADYQCEYCGKNTSLHSHHIFSRSNHHLRWDLENGACLCALHHTMGLHSAHKAPLEFAEFFKEKRGLKWYRTLIEKSRDTDKVDKDKVKQYLVDYKEKIALLEVE